MWIRRTPRGKSFRGYLKCFTGASTNSWTTETRHLQALGAAHPLPSSLSHPSRVTVLTTFAFSRHVPNPPRRPFIIATFPGNLQHCTVFVNPFGRSGWDSPYTKQHTRPNSAYEVSILYRHPHLDRSVFNKHICTSLRGRVNARGSQRRGHPLGHNRGVHNDRALVSTLGHRRDLRRCTSRAGGEG